MKKLIHILICAAVILSLCACGNAETAVEKGTAVETAAEKETAAETAAEKETAVETADAARENDMPASAEEEETKAGTDAAADNYTDAAEYEIVISQDINISNVRYNEDLVITGSNGRVVFTDCEFNGNIINKGGEGAKIMLISNINVCDGFKLVIDSEVKEGTMESDIPKFMVFTGNYPVECTNAGGVVNITKEKISFNGEEYGMDACDYYIKESTGEFGEYAGQDAAYHNICRWFENGEEVIMNIAIDE